MSKKNSKKQSMALEEDHFSPEVMVVPLLRDFEQPKIEKYDESSNHVDHVRAFVDLMRLRLTPDDIMCRAFLPTLRREARDWVVILLLKSICIQRRAADRFHCLVHEGHTGNQRYVDVCCSHCHDEWNSKFPFQDVTFQNPPDTMHELLRRRDTYVDTEEAYFITKGMKDRKEHESNKRKTRDEPELRDDKGKHKINHLR
ncbi:Ribonuclease H [Abeliophyllum distichum]|uniref:Ribonuclease H n=1 Tax=Abeliophyllum distichum TaxID=126358 RepID=A0ABD1U0V9_9LAMI